MFEKELSLKKKKERKKLAVGTSGNGNWSKKVAKV